MSRAMTPISIKQPGAAPEGGCSIASTAVILATEYVFSAMMARRLVILIWGSWWMMVSSVIFSRLQPVNLFDNFLRDRNNEAGDIYKQANGKQIDGYFGSVKARLQSEYFSLGGS